MDALKKDKTKPKKPPRLWPWVRRLPVLNNIHGHYVSFKLPMRIFAVFVIFLLSAVTYSYTFQTMIWMRDLVPHTKFAQEMVSNIMAHLCGAFVGIATLVQSAGVIWDKMSYWGQVIDNYFIRLISRKKYFLDEADQLLIEIRKLINQANKELFDIYKISITKSLNAPATQEALEKLNKQLEDQLEKADKLYQRAVTLLKKEPCDQTNRLRKDMINGNLNNFIVQLSETMRRNRTTHKQLNKKFAKPEKNHRALSK